ncbi:MAG: hypothetical protein VYA30_15290 [Myxococcota bacterium]|nr:hypothetical protein [Myxococcota bacterium]
MLPINALVLALLSSVCWARPDYVRRVPTRYGCETCHLDPRNRNLRTGFGIDFGLSRGIWAVDDDPMVGICALDSDGDGLSNGTELGDPDCGWRVGDRLPAASVTNPADDLDPDQCGDGIRQGGEACDGLDLAQATCESQGFLGGEVACSAACQYDYSDCLPRPPPDAGGHDAAFAMDQGVDLDSSADIGPNVQPVDDSLIDSGVDALGHAPDMATHTDVGLQSEIDRGSVHDASPSPDVETRVGDSRPTATRRVSERGGCQVAMGGPNTVLWACGLMLIRLFRRGDR